MRRPKAEHADETRGHPHRAAGIRADGKIDEACRHRPPPIRSRSRLESYRGRTDWLGCRSARWPLPDERQFIRHGFSDTWRRRRPVALQRQARISMRGVALEPVGCRPRRGTCNIDQSLTENVRPDNIPEPDRASSQRGPGTNAPSRRIPEARSALPGTRYSAARLPSDAMTAVESVTNPKHFLTFQTVASVQNSGDVCRSNPPPGWQP